jgi:hypothetical protein
MAKRPYFNLVRTLENLLPAAVVVLAAACSDLGDSGGGRNTSGGGANTTTGNAGPGTGSNSTGSLAGPTGAGGSQSTGPGTTGNPATGGPVTTGGGATGSGGSGAGGASNDGGIVSDAGKTGDTTCGAGVTPMGIGRCANAPKYIVAKGTALTIANFEDPGPNNDHNTIFFGDGRAGNFINLKGTNTATMTVAQTAGTPNVNGAQSWAIHFNGTYTSGPMPMLAIPVADCYDSRAYHGVSFWIKGNPGAGNTMLKFQVHTPVAQPAPSGGCSAADTAAGKCDDHFAKLVAITTGWTKYTIKWTDLKQNCPSNIPAGYTPAQYNEMFSFAIPTPGAGFDFWLDDFTFDTGDLPGKSLGDIISEPTFNEMWSLANADGTITNLRNPFYTYQGMMTAIGSFPQISGDATDFKKNRLEAAALFSNIAHETDQLGIIEEKGCQSDHVCTQYGVAPNGLTYHGRGPIQLTLGVNYSSASSALGLGSMLADNPEIVATDAAISWKTGFWFWMGGLSGGGTTPHQAITSGQGLGATIRIINGIECGGANAAAVQNRIRHFKRFSYMFGFDPGDATNGC